MNIDLDVDAPTVAAVLALLGVLITLWVNGDRSERDRRRRLHARALKAVLDYAEMPFRIRRRRHEPEAESSERVRLSDEFSMIQAELANCQVLLAADGNDKLAEAYEGLVKVVRNTAGKEARRAWTEPPIRSDTEMNMGDLFKGLEPFREQLEGFKRDLSRATLPRRMRWFDC